MDSNVNQDAKDAGLYEVTCPACGKKHRFDCRLAWRKDFCFNGCGGPVLVYPEAENVKKLIWVDIAWVAEENAAIFRALYRHLCKSAIKDCLKSPDIDGMVCIVMNKETGVLKLCTTTEYEAIKEGWLFDIVFCAFTRLARLDYYDEHPNGTQS